MLLGAALVGYPVLRNMGQSPFPRTSYKVGRAPALYEFFSRQPKDTLIASLARESDNLPTFSRRAVLVARGYAIPYHVGYYRQIRQRTTDLIRAQYSHSLADVQQLIQAYGVDFLLLDRAAFAPEYVASNTWIRQFQPAATEALANLAQGTAPALATVMERCAVLETEGLVVLEAACIAKAPQG